MNTLVDNYVDFFVKNNNITNTDYLYTVLQRKTHTIVKIFFSKDLCSINYLLLSTLYTAYKHKNVLYI